MHGTSVGSLSVLADGQNVWSKSGGQGAAWQRAVVGISSGSSGSLEIPFEGVRGTSWSGDIAIDDVNIMSGAAPVPTSEPTSSPGAVQNVCSFETNDGCNVWSNAVGDDDDFDWSRKSGNTPSSSTGPGAAGDGSYYLYIETSSPRRYGDKAILKSSPLPFQGSGHLKFMYSMYGASTGNLSVFAVMSGVSQNVWSKRGNQGAGWHQAVVGISSGASGALEIQFQGTRGTGYTGDIAIDHVIIE
jgi:hypothetical protein